MTETSAGTYWYGVDGILDDPAGPEQNKDDEIIYRFVFLVEGHLPDTDVMPQEMIATAGIVTYGGMTAVTNVRIKHKPDFVTPDPTE